MVIVGGRKYTFADNKGEEQSAKLYFMRMNDQGIQLLRHTLESGLKDNIENWRNQIGSIHPKIPKKFIPTTVPLTQML